MEFSSGVHYIPEPMALITCVDCKAEISDKAAACIKCGCPVAASQGASPTAGTFESGPKKGAYPPGVTITADLTIVCDNCGKAVHPLDFEVVQGPGSLTGKGQPQKICPHCRQPRRDRAAPASSYSVVANYQWGLPNPTMICPHCQKQGSVRTKVVNRKKGVSGGKVVGAIFTGGLSLLGTGLSRKEQLTQAHCDQCNSTWDF